MLKLKQTPTENKSTDSLQALVNIEFVLYNRTYTVGIQRFLKEAGVELSDEQIEITAKKLLSQT